MRLSQTIKYIRIDDQGIIRFVGGWCKAKDFKKKGR